MVCSLYELSAQVAVRDLNILKASIKYLHKKALYMLVKVCLMEPKKTLAFSVLIQNWPFNIFSVEAIDAKLREDDIILIASLIQKNKVGELDYIDLLHQKFRQFDERVTDAVIKVILNKESVLSIQQYNPSNIVVRSFSEALDYARSKSCFDTPEEVVRSEENTEVLLIEPYRTMTIRMEIVVNNANVTDVVKVLKMQTEAMSVKLSVARLYFDYLSASDIAKVLHVTNVDDLTGVDLSYNCLSNNNGSRLRLVCSELERFVNLQKVCFAYNTIDSSLSPILTECFKSLNKLAYLDLSCNRLGEGLVDLFTIGIQAENITMLILSGCSVTSTVITTLIESVKFNNLRKLKLDLNSELFKRKSTFVKLLNHLKNSLYYLDISSCQISKDNLLSICPDLNQCIHLYCLVIWPNRGVNLEFVKFEVLPLLRNLTHLEELPPVKDVTKFL